jgi:hypothetical protein
MVRAQHSGGTPKRHGLVVGFLLCVFPGPLLVFAPQLLAAKRKGLREYGTLAERYVRELDAQWLRGDAQADEPFVGSADIGSLASLGNSYEVVRTMRIAPITRDAIVRLAAATHSDCAVVTHHDAAGSTSETVGRQPPMANALRLCRAGGRVRRGRICTPGARVSARVVRRENQGLSRYQTAALGALESKLGRLA